MLINETSGDANEEEKEKDVSYEKQTVENHKHDVTITPETLIDVMEAGPLACWRGANQLISLTLEKLIS